MNKVLQFGEFVEEADYILRPGAYAILLNEKNQLAVVNSSNGQVLLPGGGIKKGESVEDALIREVMEEVGLTVSAGDYVGVAKQYCYSRKRAKYYNKLCNYFFAENLGAPEEPAEFKLIWLSLSEAIDRMGHDSHIWALKKLNLENC